MKHIIPIVLVAFVMIAIINPLLGAYFKVNNPFGSTPTHVTTMIHKHDHSQMSEYDKRVEMARLYWLTDYGEQ